ncbi:hypothetical protein ABPG77_009672 [Micractinium sp. CCAP 211/92]
MPPRSPIPPCSNTERALLAHVLRSAKKGSPESVLKAIDDFCYKQAWMMNIGDEKGAILDLAVASTKPLRLALELGTYCGYSAVRVARLLPPGAKLVAVDPSDVPAEVAAPILEHAGLSDRVELMNGTAAEVLPTLRERGLLFDLLLIDHDKDQYLPDLRRAEALELLRPGAVVVADNVVVFKLEGYLEHVRKSGQYSSSQLHQAHLEYDASKADGVEVSVYAGDAKSATKSS